VDGPEDIGVKSKKDGLSMTIHTDFMNYCGAGFTFSFTASDN
jgi:hypothetical protein